MTCPGTRSGDIPQSNVIEQTSFLSVANLELNWKILQTLNNYPATRAEVGCGSSKVSISFLLRMFMLKRVVPTITFFLVARHPNI
jgi:hypothetical protein